MLKNILTLIFAFIAIIYTYQNIVKAIYFIRNKIGNVPMLHEAMMAIGIIGVIACQFMKW